MLKKCRICKLEKETSRFSKNRRVCKSCRSKKPKLEAFNHYGCKCSCCGETIVDFLTIDHIGGGGNQHRKQLPQGGHSIYRWLKKNNYPEGFRVLCFNCNFGIHINNGICPHCKK